MSGKVAARPEVKGGSYAPALQGASGAGGRGRSAHRRMRARSALDCGGSSDLWTPMGSIGPQKSGTPPWVGRQTALLQDKYSKTIRGALPEVGVTLLCGSQ
jgi:hypothetical protein